MCIRSFHPKVNDIFPMDVIHGAVKDGTECLKNDDAIDPFVGGGKLNFPTTYSNINTLSIHQRLLTAVSQLLGTKHFKMKQAVFYKKEGEELKEEYGRFDNVDQRYSHLLYFQFTVFPFSDSFHFQNPHGLSQSLHGSSSGMGFT